MKGKEIIAEKIGTRQKMHQRFFENGERFIKHIPFSPQIIIQIREQLKDKSVEIELNENKWIRIKKIERDMKMENAISNELKIKEPSLDMQANIEVNMLKQAGFIVKINDIEIENE